MKTERTRTVRDRGGMALVVVMMALAVIVAFVVEFSYGVYVDMHLLQNWREGRRLAALATSGAALATGFISQNIHRQTYTYPGFIVLPSQDPFDDGTTVDVMIVDEEGKFNVNTMVHSNGSVNEKRYKGFRRLLSALDIDPQVADHIADWLDEDSIPTVAGAEDDARNGQMTSTEELLLIKGIDRETYDKLKPYVTVHGDGLVNINAAEPPVLMAVSEKIDASMAKRVVGYREVSPFKEQSNIAKVAGFSRALATELSTETKVKGKNFMLKVTATSQGGLARTVECVTDSSGLIQYWKEY